MVDVCEDERKSRTASGEWIWHSTLENHVSSSMETRLPMQLRLPRRNRRFRGIHWNGRPFDRHWEDSTWRWSNSTAETKVMDFMENGWKYGKCEILFRRHVHRMWQFQHCSASTIFVVLGIGISVDGKDGTENNGSCGDTSRDLPIAATYDNQILIPIYISKNATSCHQDGMLFLTPSFFQREGMPWRLLTPLRSFSVGKRLLLFLRRPTIRYASYSRHASSWRMLRCTIPCPSWNCRHQSTCVQA